MQEKKKIYGLSDERKYSEKNVTGQCALKKTEQELVFGMVGEVSDQCCVSRKRVVRTNKSFE